MAWRDDGLAHELLIDAREDAQQRAFAGTVQAKDANLCAIGLFILWVYYTAIVFLLGAVVAETWELKKMLHRQRAILG